MAPRQRKSKSSAIAKARIKDLPFNRILPNVTTLIALCTGLSAIRFALMGNYEFAVTAIIIAAIFDAMDGRLARFLGTDTHFGAELDSLSDIVSFGVAPAVVLYITALHQWKGLGWAIALFFVTCSALRLARFNVTNFKDEDTPSWTKRYFAGVPAPTGALLVLLAMIVSFATELPLLSMPSVNAFLLVVVGLLMISRVPTFSLKGHQIPQRKVLPLMLMAGVLIAAMINAPWHTLVLVAAAYILSIPFSSRLYNRQHMLENSSSCA